MKNLKQISLKINHILFWWYYKRVPKFFHQWPILKSISILKQNYEHALFREKGLNDVISNAIKREDNMREEISNLKLKLMGVSQSDVDSINTIFGTNLKGKSKEENEN
jgi:hypothetical protein